MKLSTNRKIIFFDGYCNLCNAFVDWLVEKHSGFKFASLQGETATQLKIFGNDSVVYLRDGEQHEKSTAALNILADVGGIYRFAKYFLIIPRTIRDFIYEWVAKNRYLFFGKRKTCRLPTAEEQSRFLP